MKQVSTLALAALIIGAVLIGSAPILVRLADEVTAVSSAFWRVAIAAPIFMVLAHRFGGLAGRGIPLGGLALLGGLFALDLAFWHLSLQYTTVAHATVLSNLTPIVVALGGLILFRERLGNLFYLGLVMAVGGSILLSLASAEMGGGRLFGDMLAVITALFYGSYLLTAGRLRGGHPTLRIMAWACAGSAIVLLPVALAWDGPFLPATAAGWWPLVGLALVPQIAGQGLIVYALAHLPAPFGAVTLLIQPVVAAIVAWHLFGERLVLTDYIGAGIILSGIVIARLGSAPRPSRKSGQMPPSGPA